MDRRQMLAFLGSTGIGAAALAACQGSGRDAASSAPSASTTTLTPAMFGAATSCALTPAETQGPYYIDVDKLRRDIREDRKGTRLRVGVRVLNADGCTALDNAVLDVWHCDAGGIYSGFGAASTGQGGGDGGPTDNYRFLRGAQVTNGDGIAEIVTIYPGWYRGRTVHIHAKVYTSNTEVLTTQLYFDERLNDRVLATAPYATHAGRDTFNDGDSIFTPDTVMTVSKDGDGYLGLITVTVKT
jgi:protocatechuate 3,4-dioxygenase beta subunit